MKKILVVLVALVFGLPLLAGTALWVVGQREGALHVGKAIQIDRPAAAVWRYLAEPDQLKRWTSGIVEITPISGAGTAVGTKSKVVARGRPEEEPITMEHLYTVVEPNKRLGFMLSAEMNGMGFSQKVEQRLDEKNGVTTLTMNADVEFKGFIPRLFGPLIVASAAEKAERDLRALKHLVETETPVPAAPISNPASADGGVELAQTAAAPALPEVAAQAVVEDSAAADAGSPASADGAPPKEAARTGEEPKNDEAPETTAAAPAVPSPSPQAPESAEAAAPTP